MIVYLLLALPILWAVWSLIGLVRCYKERWLVPFLVSLIGLAGVIFFCFCIVIDVSQVRYVPPPKGEFCATPNIDQYIDDIIEVLWTYGPWLILSAVLSTVGGWVSLVRKIQQGRTEE